MNPNPNSTPESARSGVHPLKRVGIIIAILLLMTTLRYSTLLTESDPAVFSITLLGFMLILSYNLGKVLQKLKLPKLTIYLLTGILCGPFVAGFVSADVVKNLKFVDNLALGLIAFIAGGEMRFKELLKLRSILFNITLFETLFVFLLVSVAMLALTPWIVWTADQSFVFCVMVSLLMGSLLIANSPAVTIGVIGEYRSKGILTETILGTVVLKDLIVIVVFSVVSGVAVSALIPSGTFDGIALAGQLGYEIFGSIGLGLAVGILVWLYIRFVGEQNVLFIVGVAFMCYELARYFHMEVLLIGVTAGFFVQNFTRQGEKLIEHVEEGLPVVYPVFFSIAGAKLDLFALQELWFVALLLAAARATGVYVGVRTGARIAQAPETVRQGAWMGLISQAGVALGLAIIVGRKFPEWGGSLQTLIIPVIGINELIGPILLKRALDKAGEIRSAPPDTLIRLQIGSTEDDVRKELKIKAD